MRKVSDLLAAILGLQDNYSIFAFRIGELQFLEKVQGTSVPLYNIKHEAN